MPAKHLSRKPFVLMLKDDSGEIAPVKLDPTLANSDNALIVLDEYNDTCWVWVGRNVNMPTRMHALRMGKSLQKSGHKIKVTTIGMASSNYVELLEKDDSDPSVAANIDRFRQVLSGKWSFDDQYLAYDKSKASQYEAEPVSIVDSAPHREPEPDRPSPSERAREYGRKVPERTPHPPTPPPAAAPAPAPVQTAVSAIAGNIAEKKAAFLLYSAVKNTEVLYVERFQRDGQMGFKIEAPGAMVVEALIDDNDVKVIPSDFGNTDVANKTKSDYEAWLGKL